MKPKVLSMFMISLVFIGCSSVYVMPDGQTTTMPPSTSAARAHAQVSPVGYKKSLQYESGILCHYMETKQLPSDKSEAVNAFTLSIKPFRDKNHVVIEYEDGNVNSAIIDLNGKLLEFNLLDEQTGERVVSDEYVEYLNKNRAKKIDDGSLPKGRTYFINPLSVLLPEFFKDVRVRRGKKISVITKSNGEVWGHYVFRGQTTYKERKVYVLDLIRLMPGYKSVPVLVGFSFIDKVSSIPVYTAIEVGSKMIVQQTSCD